MREALLRAYDDAGSFLDRPPLSSVPGRTAVDDGDPAATGGARAPSNKRSLSDSLRFLNSSDSPGVVGTLDPYEVLEEIGRGGLGIVLKARDTRLQRMLAIKVPVPEFAANALARKRFQREAEAAAAVSHDHVVTIHAGDRVRFRQAWTGEPHSVTFGRTFNDELGAIREQHARDAGSRLEARGVSF